MAELNVIITVAFVIKVPLTKICDQKFHQRSGLYKTLYHNSSGHRSRMPNGTRVAERYRRRSINVNAYIQKKCKPWADMSYHD